VTAGRPDDTAVVYGDGTDVLAISAGIAGGRSAAGALIELGDAHIAFRSVELTFTNPGAESGFAAVLPERSCPPPGLPTSRTGESLMMLNPAPFITSRRLRPTPGMNVWQDLRAENRLTAHGWRKPG
jgi:hypothetical protein